MDAVIAGMEGGPLRPRAEQRQSKRQMSTREDVMTDVVELIGMFGVLTIWVAVGIWATRSQPRRHEVSPGAEL
jgi:hypothetical protein